MQRKCHKCNRKQANDAFICPYCGAILGETIKTTVSWKATPSHKPMRRRFLLSAAVLLLVVLLLLGGYWIGGQLWGDQGSTTTLPNAESLPTTAPMVEYHMQIRSGRKNLEGVEICLWHGDELLYTCQSGSYGKATFLLPQREGYCITLSALPEKYYNTFDDVRFFFPEGSQELLVALEDTVLSYTVKVVNEAGEPMPGAKLRFHSPHQEDMLLISDESGICAFTSKYAEGNIYASVEYLPTGYDSIRGVSFSEGKRSVELVLQKYEDRLLMDDQALYTVQIMDEYGQPVPDLEIYIVEPNRMEYLIRAIGVTNLDGYFAFTADKDAPLAVDLAKNLDYSGFLFQFEEGKTHLQIELELHKTEFTYSIQFVNQAEDPVSGVQIVVTTADSAWTEIYTSDESGIITFVCGEADPLKLRFYVTDAPEGYVLDPQPGMGYTFTKSSRRTTVKLLQLTVLTLVDAQGQPIAGAELLLQSGFGLGHDMRGTTDENGQCSFPLPENDIYVVSVEAVPDGYPLMFFLPEYIDVGMFEMTIAPRSIFHTYHLYLKDPEGRPVGDAQVDLYLQNGACHSVLTNDQGYSQFYVQVDSVVEIDGAKIVVASEEYFGYDYYTVEYGEDRCIYITIFPQPTEP